MTIKTKKKDTPEIEKEAKPSNNNETAKTVASWLTLELLLYIIIAIVAITLRLWKLGAYPLSDLEAEQSLIALNIYRGQPPGVDYYSPLLVSLNALFFLIFDSSEISARLSSVLLGFVLVMLPATLRRRLGVMVCLIASALLAISPSTLYLSRTVNGEVGAAVGALMIISGFFNWAEEGYKNWLFMLAGGVALLVSSGAAVYSVLVVFVLIILFKLSTFKALWAKGVAVMSEQFPPALEMETDNDEKSEQGIHPALRDAAVFIVVVVGLVATTALFNLSGFITLTSSFTEWLSWFASRPDAGFNAVFLLTIYEPLLVISGLIGLALVIIRGNLLAVLFAVWFVLALLLDALMVGRSNGAVMLSLPPLIFLSSFVLTDLWGRLQKYGSRQNEGLLLIAGLVIAVFGYIGLTGWLNIVCTAEDTLCAYRAVAPFLVAPLLFLIIALFFAFLNGTARVAVRGGLLVGVVIGLLITVNIGWRLNYGPMRYIAYQPLSGIPPSTELVSLADTLSAQSSRRVGDDRLLDITLVGDGSPALLWQLRDYRYLKQTTSANEPTTAIITSPNIELQLGQSYVGQDFALDSIWSPLNLPPKQLVKWLIYRHIEEQPQSNKTVLWLMLK